MDGALAAIDVARGAGLRVAIASSSSRSLIDAVVERLGIASHVELLLSADDEKRGKPAPDVYLTAARRLEVAPDQCLAVEDSPVGVQSAKAAGMSCVGLVTHEMDPGELSAADEVITSLRDFTPALIARLGSGGVDVVGRRRG